MSERRLRDEAEFQEQTDGALTQQLGEARGVMDGKEVELAIRVESALEDQGVEMRFKPECVTEGLIGEDCSAGDGLAGRGGVELDDQREDQPGDEAEEPLVVTEEYPKSFRDGEDELPVGKGKKQVLVEVLGEKKGPLLAAGRA
jgi:plasmid stability protein